VASRHPKFSVALLVAALVGWLLAAAAPFAVAEGRTRSNSRPARIASVPAAAQSPAVTSRLPPKPPPTPGPIVPRGDPVTKIGVVAMVVAAVAGLWIYRVIRKGL
jgi:hypothetical protein